MWQLNQLLTYLIYLLETTASDVFALLFKEVFNLRIIIIFVWE